MTQLVGKSLLFSRRGCTFTATPTDKGWVLRKLVGGHLVRVGTFETRDAAMEAAGST